MAEDELTVRLLAELTGLRQGMADAQRTVGQGVGGIRDQLTRLGDAHRDWQTRWNQGWELAERVVRTFGQVWDATIGGVVARGEEFQQLGRRLQTNTGDLSALSFATRQAGVDLGDLGLGYRTLSRALVEAKDTSSEAHRTLVQGLGFTVAELDRLKRLAPHEAILQVAQALAQHEDGAEKAAAGQTLFGRAFQTVLILMGEGPDVIRENIELAQRFGLVMEQDVADASDRVGDAQDRLSAVWEGFYNRLFGDADMLNAIAAALEGTADEFADMGRSIPESEMDALRGAVVGLAESFRSLTPDAAAAATQIAKVVDAVKWVVDNREAIATAFAGMLGGALVGARAGGVPGAVVGGAVGGLGGLQVGGRVGAGRQQDDAVLAQARADLAEAQERLREKSGVSGLGMTFESGTQLPTTDLGSPSVLPKPPKVPLRVPDDDGEEEKRARREAYEALLREQERALVGEQDSAEKRLEIVRSFSERIQQQFGAESEEFDRQKLVVLRAEQAVGRERHETILRDQERDLVAVRNDAEARLQIVRGYTDRIKAEFGETSAEYQRQLTLQLQAEQAAADQKTALAVQAIEADRDAKLRQLEQEKQRIESARQLGIISDSDALNRLQAYHDERLRIIREAIAEERALRGGEEPQPGEEPGGTPGGTPRDPAALAELDAEERGAEDEHAGSTQELLAQRQQQLKAEFESLFSAIGQGWDRTVLGMIQGTQTFEQGVRNMGMNVLAQLSSTFVQIAARWAATQLAQLLIQRSTDSAKVGSTASAAASKAAIEAPEAIRSITQNAANAASGAASAVASIPYVGPILAVANAAAIFATVIGYARNVSAAGGLGEVGPEGAFAQLHPKEMVLPADLAEGVRRMTRVDGGGAQGLDPETTGATQAVTVTYNVSMIDTRGAKDFFARHGRELEDHLQRRGRLRNQG